MEIGFLEALILIGGIWIASIVILFFFASVLKWITERRYKKKYARARNKKSSNPERPVYKDHAIQKRGLLEVRNAQSIEQNSRSLGEYETTADTWTNPFTTTSNGLK